MLTERETYEVKSQNNIIMKKYLIMAAMLLMTNLKSFATGSLATDNTTSIIYGYVGLLIFLIFFVIALSIALYVIVAKMAKDRKRSVILWVILSFFISPILSIIILYFVGEEDENSTKLID